jgi:hypothetical protein
VRPGIGARVGRAVLVLTALGTAGQTFYYLYYWEWVRAQLSATMLVATMVVGATWLVLGRIDRLESRLDERLRVPAPPRRVPSATTPAGPGPYGGVGAAPDLPWLDPRFGPRARGVALPALAGALAATGPEPAVFIPVLLGTGVLVAAVAGLVERLSVRVHRDGGRGGTGRPAARLALVAVLAVAVPAGIWWGAHDFERPLREGRTELTVRVESRSDRPLPPVEAVGTVGRYCARNAISRVRVDDVRPGPPGTAVLVVSPLLDPQSTRRYGGCLEDAVLFRHRLTVVRDVAEPARP